HRRPRRRIRPSQHGDRPRSEEPRRMKRKVERQLRLLERPLPWIALGVMAILFSAVLGFIVDFGLLEHVDRETFGAPLRGYTLIGLASGVFALLSLGVVLVYSLRKRSWQERLPLFRSTMMTWLWSHVTLGLLAVALASLHGGYGVISLHMSSGKLAFAILVLLMLSGIVWRIVYQVVPPIAAPRIGNYSEEGSKRRADEQLTEI